MTWPICTIILRTADNEIIEIVRFFYNYIYVRTYARTRARIHIHTYIHTYNGEVLSYSIIIGCSLSNRARR